MTEVNSVTEAKSSARKDFTNLRHRPFLIINTIQRPAKGVNTSKKGWTELEQNWAIFENPYVADRVSDKMMREATVIIDVMRGVCVKSRFDQVTEDEVVHHYLDKYREQVKEAMDIWLNRMAQRMAADPNFARSERGDKAVAALQAKIDASTAAE
jgi:hypothetical protein